MIHATARSAAQVSSCKFPHRTEAQALLSTFGRRLLHRRGVCVNARQRLLKHAIIEADACASTGLAIWLPLAAAYRRATVACCAPHSMLRAGVAAANNERSRHAGQRNLWVPLPEGVVRSQRDLGR